MTPKSEKPKYDEMLTIHIKETLKNLQSEEKHVPRMDIVYHLVQPLSSKKAGY